jgi:hypothetical protein
MLKDLFDWFRPKASDEGVAEGLRLVKLTADKAGDEWKLAAYQAFIAYAKSHKYFTTEDVRFSMKNAPQPSQLQAWGHIARLALKNGVMVHHDFVRPKSGTVHGKHVNLWQSTLLP